MSLKLIKNNTFNIKSTLLVMSAAAIVGGISYASLNAYDQYRHQAAAQQAQQAAIQRLQARDAEIKQARYDASINRLVSICTEDQQKFDALTAKEKIGKFRPDCTVEVQ